MLFVVKDNDRIYIGSDCYTGITLKNRKNRNNLDIVAPKDVENCLLANEGALNSWNVIKTIPGLLNLEEAEGNIDHKYISTHVFPKIINSLIGAMFIENDAIRFLNNSIVIAYKDRAYRITNHGYIYEIDESDSLGFNSAFTNAHLDAHIGEDPVYRILKAYYDATVVYGNSCEPFVITDTVTREFKFYDLDDAEDYIEEYESRKEN